MHPRQILAALLIPTLASTALAQADSAAIQKAASRAPAQLDSTAIQKTGQTSPLAAIAGKIAGAHVVTLSGEPGASAALIVRASASHSTPDPLIVIDGTTSRLSLSDIDVGDIARIDVLKGASAAATYGIGAANGVVLITTKRARDVAPGTTSISLRSELGATRPPSVLPVSMTHRFQLDASGNFVLDANGNRVPDADEIDDNAYPVIYDRAATMLGGQALLANRLSAAHRLASTSVYASVDHVRDPGIVKLLSGYERRAARVNLDQSIGRWFEVTAGGYYVSASTDSTASQGSDIWELRMLEPNVRLDSTSTACGGGVTSCYVGTVRTYYGSTPNPLYDLQQSTGETGRERFTAALSGTFHLLSWLDATARYTGDRARQNARLLYYYYPIGTVPNRAGRLIIGDQRINTTSAELSAQRSIFGRRMASRLAWIREHEKRSGDTTTFQIPSSTPGAGSSFGRSNETESYLFESSIEAMERLNFEAGIRYDRPSAYFRGEQATYHRLAASYRAPRDIVLHAGHGTSSYPFDLDRVPLVLFPIGTPITPLRLPYVHETEIGVDGHVLGRYSLGYSYARERVGGYTARVIAPGALGYYTLWRNVGAVGGATHEMSVGLPLIERGDRSLHVNLVAHRTRARITKLDSPAMLYGASNEFRLQEGERLGTLWGMRTIRTQAQLQETIDAGRLTGTVADYVLNEQGYYVTAATYHTPLEAPLMYAQCQQRDATGACYISQTAFPLGNVVPDLELGLTTDARWRALSAHATFTSAIGGEIYNRARAITFLYERDPVFDQAQVPVSERKPGGYYRFFGGYSSGPNELTVESGTHVKLRDLSLDWTVPARWASRARASSLRLGLVGRNLWTWSRYSGHDADIPAGTTYDFAFGVENVAYPAYRSVSVVVKAGW